MNTRRGFLGSVAALVAALPFVGRGVASSGVTNPTVAPSNPWALTPVADAEYTPPLTAERAAVATQLVMQETPDALKLHEIMALYRDGYIDTPTMRTQVRTLFPLNAAKVDDGRAAAGEISTEGIRDGRRTDIRATHAAALNELYDVTANGMPAFVEYNRNRDMA